MTVVVDHDSGRLVWAAPGRDTATLRRFFDALGAERAAQITHVSANAADWISDVVAERCPTAMWNRNLKANPRLMPRCTCRFAASSSTWPHAMRPTRSARSTGRDWSGSTRPVRGYRDAARPGDSARRL